MCNSGPNALARTQKPKQEVKEAAEWNNKLGNVYIA
jgi:hypothetical protein